MSEPIKSVDEFVARTEKLEGRMFLYRGLPCANWLVESSAYRRLREPEKDPSPDIFQNYIRELLDRASSQGFRYQHDRKWSDLELLAELQHYGAATCLIDFTRNALIALWFACREEPKQIGKVVALATDDFTSISIVNYEESKKSVYGFLNRGKLQQWTTGGLDSCTTAQQSVFIFGKGATGKYLYEKIEIDARSKKSIILTLEKSLGVKEEHFFNDFGDYSPSRTHSNLSYSILHA